MKTDLRDIFVDKLKIESKVTAIDSVFGNEDRVKKTVFNPPYQRNYVWDAEKATYFIESLLIGTEIPPLVFFRKIGRLEIIDGRQRYETILRFMNGGLKLKKSGLKKLDGLEIENCSFRDLPINMQNDFLETKIHIIEFSLPSVYMDMGLTSPEGSESWIAQFAQEAFDKVIKPHNAIANFILSTCSLEIT